MISKNINLKSSFSKTIQNNESAFNKLIKHLDEKLWNNPYSSFELCEIYITWEKRSAHKNLSWQKHKIFSGFICIRNKKNEKKVKDRIKEILLVKRNSCLEYFNILESNVMWIKFILPIHVLKVHLLNVNYRLQVARNQEWERVFELDFQITSSRSYIYVQVTIYPFIIWYEYLINNKVRLHCNTQPEMVNTTAPLSIKKWIWFDLIWFTTNTSTYNQHAWQWKQIRKS